MFKTIADFKAELARLPEADAGIRDAAAARNAMLTKPAGALGKLEDLAAALKAALTAPPAGGRPPRLRRTLAGALVTLAGDHIQIEAAPPRRPTSRAAKTA